MGATGGIVKKIQDCRNYIIKFVRLNALTKEIEGKLKPELRYISEINKEFKGKEHFFNTLLREGEIKKYSDAYTAITSELKDLSFFEAKFVSTYLNRKYFKS